MEKDVVIVGGGAAGMLAAGICAGRGLRTLLLEKNERLGRKLAITGKGRCNLTNACDRDTFLSAFPMNSKFLYRAVTAFPPEEAIRFFEGLGVPLKTERGGRVFPCSDRAYDIVDALVDFIKKSRCEIRHQKAAGLILQDKRVTGVRTEPGEEISCNSLLLATGGVSYPVTGSTGEGHALAKQVGHRIVPLKPALIPLVVRDIWCKKLQGLTLRNVSLSLYRTADDKKPLFTDFGEMLFTHFGISGPLALSASVHVQDDTPAGYVVFLDLKPALSFEKLDSRLQRDLEQNSNKNFRNLLSGLLPQKLVPIFALRCEIPLELKVHQITKKMRHAVIEMMKRFKLELCAFRPIEEAIVTAGGVDTKEIHPGTMESRLVKGLYFAGEIIDIAGYTGGFNLQAAFATGYLAGNHMNIA